MISYLTGKPLFDIEQALVLDVRDVGYHIYTTEATLSWALMQTQLSLWIQTIVRENTLDLYGFETQKELYFFKKLLDVSGIGPKSALGIIGLASTDTLYQAIIGENITFLTSVPGIGKKTAQRMCIELRDKLKDYQSDNATSLRNEDGDVVDALVALGYSPTQAHTALSHIDKTIEGVNNRIKAALHTLN